MSLYNMLFGQSSNTDILLAILKLTREDCGRFRDIYLNDDGTEIILYTRNGGGNRECWCEEDKPCACTASDMDNLTLHPNYIRDWDDDFDCTYAYISFTIPEGDRELCKALATGENPTPVGEKFQSFVTKMKEGNE